MAVTLGLSLIKSSRYGPTVTTVTTATQKARHYIAAVADKVPKNVYKTLKERLTDFELPDTQRMRPSSTQTTQDRDSAVHLHIGCGKRNIPGFINVDILAFPHIDHVTGADDLGFADDNSVDMIYACHVLEHFGRNEYEAVLREWWRVLKVGGVLRISVPDFQACANIYCENGLEDGLSGLIGLISGGQRDEYDFHKMIFDEPVLTAALLRVGFGSTHLWDWRQTDHVNCDDYSQAYIPHMDKENGRLMSLNLEAIK